MSATTAAQTNGHVSLCAVLDAVAQAGTGTHVSVDDVVATVGPRGFGSLLLIPALIVLTPASAIPGLSSVGGLVIALIAAQYIAGRDQVWLPDILGKRCVPRTALESAVSVLWRPAAWIDRLLKRRLDFLTTRPLAYVLVGVCMIIGAVMPLFELIPMSSSILAGIVSLFALALATRDGVVAILAYAMLAVGAYGIAYLV